MNLLREETHNAGEGCSRSLARVGWCLMKIYFRVGDLSLHDDGANDGRGSQDAARSTQTIPTSSLLTDSTYVCTAHRQYLRHYCSQTISTPLLLSRLPETRYDHPERRHHVPCTRLRIENVNRNVHQLSRYEAGGGGGGGGPETPHLGGGDRAAGPLEAAVASR